MPRKRSAIARMPSSFVPALDDHVDLDRRRGRRRAPRRCPRARRPTGKSTSFIARNVASSSESSETVTRFRPASASVCAMRASSDAVRRQRDVADARHGGEARDQLVDAAAHERLAARDAELLDAHAGERAREPLDLLERQQLLAAQELELLAEDLLGHAVDAAEVAAVGDRDAQIPHGPGELCRGRRPSAAVSRRLRSSLDDAWRSRSDSARCRSSTVDDRTIELFGEASTDRNPLHFDDEFGRADAVRRPHRARHDHRGLHLGDDRQRAPRARLGLPRRRRSSSARRCGRATRCASRWRCSTTTPARRGTRLSTRAFVGDTLVVDGEAKVIAPA